MPRSISPKKAIMLTRSINVLVVHGPVSLEIHDNRVPGMLAKETGGNISFNVQQENANQQKNANQKNGETVSQ